MRAACEGFLQHIPGSWLLQLVRSLPQEDKLAVFQTSRWLARHVVESASSIKLSPGGKYNHQCSSISQLLADASDSLQVELVARLSAAPAFFPTLRQWICCLDVETVHDASCINACWSYLPRLTTLKIHGYTSESVRPLCEALHAGHLRHIHTLHFSCYSYGIFPYTGSSATSVETFQQLVCALQTSTCLTSVRTDSNNLLHHLQNFKTLQRVHIDFCGIDSDAMKQLCDHPTLQDVELNGCTIHTSEAWPTCKWQSLTLCGCAMKDLSSLPLSCIQQVIFLFFLAPCDDEDQAALLEALTHYAPKLTCQPKDGGFHLLGVCEPVVRLVTRLCAGHALWIDGSLQFPSLLRCLWLALPPCITKVAVTGRLGGIVSRFDWSQFWSGMPITVKHVVFTEWHVSPHQTLAEVVSKAPVHIQRLQVHDRHPERFEGLHSVAPAHVTLEISH